jgi:hypothetical protein
VTEDFHVKKGIYSTRRKNIPWHRREKVFARGKWLCAVCNGFKLTVDHIVPKCLGSVNSKYNLIALCESCNNKKGNKQPFEWLQSISAPSRILYCNIILAIKMHMVNAEPQNGQREFETCGKDD